MFRFTISVFFIFATALASTADEVKTSHDGLTLNANLNIAEGRTLADGVVLMVHGTLAHKDMEIMAMLQELLIERDISNLSINLSHAQDDRHGMNDCVGPLRHLDTDGIAEIGLWVDWLKSQGAAKITVLGHSRGANQVARYASGTADPAVIAAVLVGSPTWQKGKSAEGYSNRYQADLAPVLAEAQALVGAGKGDTLMQGVNFAFCPDTVVAAATFAENYTDAPDRDTPSVIERIGMPVLVVVGTEDTVVPNLAERMRGTTQANVLFTEIEDASHFFLDFYGEDLADLVAGFLADNGV